MSRVLCTMPGRHGDILWALPTVRAISDHYRQPIDLLIAGEFGGLLPLLHLQPYLGQVIADERWNAHEPLPPRAIVDEPEPDEVIHLGYTEGWPQRPLPYEAARLANKQLPDLGGIDLTTPWITVAPWQHRPHPILFGWSETWFELKYGLCQLLTINWTRPQISGFYLAASGRWTTETGMEPVDWLEAARRITAGQLFVGDCSALHVLAVAIGRPVLLVEPMEARWNPVFYPLGKDGPQVRLIRGLDGNPTFDARHVAEAMQETLDGDRSTRSQTV